MLKEQGRGAATFNRTEDRNPFNYDHANPHLAKAANYSQEDTQSFRTIVIIFLYTHSVPPPQLPWLQVERIQANLRLITAHQCEFES